MKDVTHRYVFNLPLDMLRSTFENVIMGYNLLSERGALHTENSLKYVSETIKNILN